MCYIKTEGELSSHKAWDRRSSLWENVSSFFRKSSLDFVIALNLSIVVICFSSGLRKLFQIYGPLIEIEYLLVLVLLIGCT